MSGTSSLRDTSSLRLCLAQHIQNVEKAVDDLLAASKSNAQPPKETELISALRCLAKADKRQLAQLDLEARELAKVVIERLKLEVVAGKLKPQNPYISKLAAIFISDPDRRIAYLQQERQFLSEQETPKIYYAADSVDETRHLTQVVKTRLLKNEEITVLVPHSEQIECLDREFQEYGLSVDTKPGGKSDTPKLMSYQAFLSEVNYDTIDTIVMPKLSAEAFTGLDEDVVRNYLFAAISSAAKWVLISTILNYELPLLEQLSEEFHNLESARILVTQFRSEVIKRDSVALQTIRPYESDPILDLL